VTAVFLVVDAGFFSANLLKIADGGWLPLLLGAGVFIVMTIWRSGVNCVHASLEQTEESPQQFLADLAAGKIPRVPGTAVFLTRFAQQIPPLMLYHVKHMGALHRRVITLTVEFEQTPRVAEERRCDIQHIADGIWHATARFGFVEIPDLRDALDHLRQLDSSLDIDGAIYFAARDLIVRKSGRGLLAHWQLPLFAFLFRNAVKVLDRFNLPSRNVVEIARQIEV
jgi:KUP system potassium uptake protein